MFDDEDLRGEVEDLFAAQQEQHQGAVEADLFGLSQSREIRRGHRSEGGQSCGAGVRVFNPDPPKTPEQKVERRTQDARNKRKRHERDIRARILAGERPNLNRRGPKPRVWFRIAKELGVDITLPAASPRSGGSTASLAAAPTPIEDATRSTARVA